MFRVRLRGYLLTRLQVRLIIIDSVTFHFRRDFEDMGMRTRMLNTMSQNLMSLAEQFNLAVCTIHFVSSTDIALHILLGRTYESSYNKDFRQRVHAGTCTWYFTIFKFLLLYTNYLTIGESWGHTCTNRVIFFWKDGKRFAHLYKSPSKKSMQVPFQGNIRMGNDFN